MNMQEYPEVLKAKIALINKFNRDIRKANPDTLLKLYRDISVINLSNVMSSDSAMLYLNNGLKLAKKHGDNETVSDLYFTLGSIYFSPTIGKWSFAIDYEKSMLFTLNAFDACLQVKPSGCEILKPIIINLNMVFFQLKKPERIIETVKPLAEKRPEILSYPPYWGDLGKAYRELGQYQKS